jgi:hypothetical protein
MAKDYTGVPSADQDMMQPAHPSHLVMVCTIGLQIFSINHHLSAVMG